MSSSTETPGGPFLAFYPLLYIAWADGELERNEALERIALRTRQFARRQRTWYRKFDITWLDPDGGASADEALQAFGWGAA